MTDESDTPYEPRDDEVVFNLTDKDGTEEKVYAEDLMLAYLLVNQKCFINTRPYIPIKFRETIEEKKAVYDFEFYKKKGFDVEKYETAIVFMNCNDVFMWGCADAEPITTIEIPSLYFAIKKDKKWGDVKWICKKRNLQPQTPIIKDMKKDDAWDEEMESLPKNKRN